MTPGPDQLDLSKGFHMTFIRALFLVIGAFFLVVAVAEFADRLSPNYQRKLYAGESGGAFLLTGLLFIGIAMS